MRVRPDDQHEVRRGGGPHVKVLHEAHTLGHQSGKEARSLLYAEKLQCIQNASFREQRLEKYLGKPIQWTLEDLRP